MSRRLILGTSAVALVVFAAGAYPVQAAKVKLGTTILEGPITDISDTSITVMGVTVNVPGEPTATIHTPTATSHAAGSQLTLSALKNADQNTLPGLPGGSIRGAHAVVQGQSNGLDANGQVSVTAVDVFTDVSESPIVGEVTSVSPLKIDGQEVEQLSESNPIMPGATPQNILGFKINPLTIPVAAPGVPGTMASVQGYYGDDGKIHYYDFQADTGTPVNTNVEVSVTKVLCVVKDGKLTVLGGAHGASFASVAGQSVSLQGSDPITPGLFKTFTSVQLADAGLTPLQSQYKFVGNAPNNICPDQVKVVFGTASVVADVTPK